jgi:hypothetical protein
MASDKVREGKIIDGSAGFQPASDALPSLMAEPDVENPVEVVDRKSVYPRRPPTIPARELAVRSLFGVGSALLAIVVVLVTMLALYGATVKLGFLLSVIIASLLLTPAMVPVIFIPQLKGCSRATRIMGAILIASSMVWMFPLLMCHSGVGALIDPLRVLFLLLFFPFVISAGRDGWNSRRHKAEQTRAISV